MENIKKAYIHTYNNSDFNIIKRFNNQSHSIKSNKEKRDNKFKYCNSIEGNINSKNYEIHTVNNTIREKSDDKNIYHPVTNIKEGKIKNSTNNDNDMSLGNDKSYNNLILNTYLK